MGRFATLICGGKNECLDEKNILKFDYIQVITSSVLLTEGPVWLNELGRWI